MMRFLSELAVGLLFAAGLTGLVLGNLVVGLLLLVAGRVVMWLFRRWLRPSPPSSIYGWTSNTSATGL
ncbi:hypothetical protein [Actinomycetospora sp. TBRC 11914]|uniref:hypothetical protein n=1 Tax=Actinomycetospora sp. TBRC 11914 TaxID=2729387 RepID=UPI00145E61FF|nr:hypothetical protein [Actinomycetospora sp. TBRC 11914]NMO93250.1 hypothetical protein [Actinomycetospora sp. TBRC 11914]